MRAKRDATFCWFDWKPSHAQLNKLKQHPFSWRSEQTSNDSINGCICYLVDEDGLPYGKEAAVTNHQMQRLPSSWMNSLQSKEDIELFKLHSMKETNYQHGLDYDHANFKVMCWNDFYQVPFLKFMNKSSSFISTLGWKHWWSCL